MLFLGLLIFEFMNRIIRNAGLLIIGLFMVQVASAQLSHKSAVGGRFGSASGLNFRYALAENRALEGILSVQSNSTSSRFRLVGLYEYYKPILPNLSWYYGFGGSIGSYKYKSFTDNSGTMHPSNTELSLSIDGIIGLDYMIPDSPISLSLDVKPYLDFIQESSIRFFDPVGFSIRYNF